MRTIDLPPDTQITLRADSISPFEYQITLPKSGTVLHAYLTRRFSSTEHDPRDCLLVGIKEGALPEEFRNLSPAFVDLRLRLNRLALESLQRLGAAKTLVNELAEQPVDDLAIVVHTFGPVPAVVAKLPNFQTSLPAAGQWTPKVIAFYPAEREMRKRPTALVGTASHREFLECLDGRLTTCFARYAEDVAGYFEHIRLALTPDKVFAAARAAEDRLGASIRSKVDFVKKVAGDDKDEALQAYAKEMAARNAAELARGKYVRTLGLYLLNELYGQIGIKRSDKYSRRLDTHARQAAEFNSEWVDQLDAVITQYRSKVPPSEWFVSPTKTTRYWAEAFREFLVFLAWLRTVPKNDPVAFLRAHTILARNSGSPVLKQFEQDYHAVQPRIFPDFPEVPKLDLLQAEAGTADSKASAYRWISEIVWHDATNILPGPPPRANRPIAKTQADIANAIIDGRRERLQLWLIGMLRFCRLHPAEIPAFKYCILELSEPRERRLVVGMGLGEGLSEEAVTNLLKIFQKKCRERVFWVAAEPLKLFQSSKHQGLVESRTLAAIQRNAAGLEWRDIVAVVDRACEKAQFEQSDWLWI